MNVVVIPVDRRVLVLCEDHYRTLARSVPRGTAWRPATSEETAAMEVMDE